MCIRRVQITVAQAKRRQAKLENGPEVAASSHYSPSQPVPSLQQTPQRIASALARSPTSWVDGRPGASHFWPAEGCAVSPHLPSSLQLAFQLVGESVLGRHLAPSPSPTLDPVLQQRVAELEAQNARLQRQLCENGVAASVHALQHAPCPLPARRRSSGHITTAAAAADLPPRTRRPPRASLQVITPLHSFLALPSPLPTHICNAMPCHTMPYYTSHHTIP